MLGSLAYMFIKFNHHQNSIDQYFVRSGMVYYEESSKLRLYLDDRYGSADSASSIDTFRGKSGILFVKYSDSNNGMIGLWDGTKVHHMDDFTNIGSTLYLWPTNKGKEVSCKRSQYAVYATERSNFRLE